MIVLVSSDWLRQRWSHVMKFSPSDINATRVLAWDCLRLRQSTQLLSHYVPYSLCNIYGFTASEMMTNGSFLPRIKAVCLVKKNFFYTFSLSVTIKCDLLTSNLLPSCSCLGSYIHQICRFWGFQIINVKTYQFTTPCKSDEVTHPKQHKSFFSGIMW